MEHRDRLERTTGMGASATLLAPERLLQHKALVRRYVEEVWNRQKLSKAREMLAPTYVYHCGATQRDYPGYGGLEEVLTRAQGAFPDRRAEIVELVAEQDLVSVRFKLSATFQGAFLGIRPTGKRLVFSAIGGYRVVDGKIADEWCHDNLAYLLLRGDAPTA
ncbi:SnoaL-like polyketide cyclase [compost metagenome]